MSGIDEIASAIETGKIKLISDLVLEAVSSGDDPMEILNRGMIRAMRIIGDRFSRGEAFVPEMLISAKTMKKGVDTLKPFLSKGATSVNGQVIVGTVSGDVHDIGKNLVAMMIESTGFEVIDLGIDVSAEQFIQAIWDNENVRIVALSTLLTTTMPAMRAIVAQINQLSCRNRFHIMVGGSPITEEFARQIGADGYAPDAASAVLLAKSFE